MKPISQAELRRSPRPNPKFLVTAVSIFAIGLVSLGGLLTSSEAVPPYPSESTPLTLVEKGIKWQANVSIPSNESSYGGLSIAVSTDAGYGVRWWIPYDSPLTLWVPYDSPLRQGTGSPVACDLGAKSLGNLTLSLNLTDVTGNGKFDSGDYFIVSPENGSQFRENTTYSVIVTSGAPILFFIKIYSFVIDEGVLYAWDSSPKDILAR
jgi:hypothetical protein